MTPLNCCVLLNNPSLKLCLFSYQVHSLKDPSYGNLWVLLEWFMKRTSWHESFVLKWNCTVCAVWFSLMKICMTFSGTESVYKSESYLLSLKEAHVIWIKHRICSDSVFWLPLHRPWEHFTNAPTSPLVICTDSDKVLAVILMSKYVCYWSRAGPLTANRALVFRTVSYVAFTNAYTDWLIRNQAFAPCRVICVNDIYKRCLLLLGASESSFDLDLFPLCGKHSGG